MRGYLELIQPSFLPFLLADVVKHELEVFGRRSEVDLILPAVELIIHDLWDLLVDEDKPIDDVEHAFESIKLALRVDETQRVEVVDAADLLDDKAALDQLAHLLRHFEGL